MMMKRFPSLVLMSEGYPWNKIIVLMLVSLMAVNQKETIECLASTAELLRPKKRTKVEELSTVTIAYMKNKRPDQAGEKLKLRVLFDSGCGATLVNKKFVRHWKKKESKTTKWSTKGGSFKTKRKCEIQITLPLPFMKTETLLLQCLCR
jgi:hypothetical protein